MRKARSVNTTPAKTRQGDLPYKPKPTENKNGTKKPNLPLTDNNTHIVANTYIYATTLNTNTRLYAHYHYTAPDYSLYHTTHAPLVYVALSYIPPLSLAAY